MVSIFPAHADLCRRGQRGASAASGADSGEAGRDHRNPGTCEAAQSFRISGVVKSGNTPIPGVTVTAANTLTGKKAITSTGLDGSYSLELAARGRYVVRAEMTSFAPATQEVVLNAGTPNQQANFSIVLLSRAPKPEQQPSGLPGLPGNGTMARSGRGTQQLSVTVDESALSAAGSAYSNGEQPSLGALSGLAGSADATNQSVTAGGQLGTMPGFLGGARTSEELRERMQDMRDQRSGFGGGGRPGGILGGFSDGPSVMRGRGFDINKPHGTFYYSSGNSLFDASPYSLNGPGTAPPGSSNRFGGLIGGPLHIPHVVKDDKTFFFGGYTGTRASNPYVAYSNVPTQDERSGNFGQVSSIVHLPRQPRSARRDSK